MISRAVDESLGGGPHRCIGPICLCTINVKHFFQISSQQYSIPRFRNCALQGPQSIPDTYALNHKSTLSQDPYLAKLPPASLKLQP